MPSSNFGGNLPGQSDSIKNISKLLEQNMPAMPDQTKSNQANIGALL